MRILITGSRDWTNEDVIFSALTLAIARGAVDNSAVTLVSGACFTGADVIAERLCREAGVAVERHPADWPRYGRAAGPHRNAEMVELGADVCLAFIGPCSSPRCSIEGVHPSHGASGTADLAERHGIETRRYFDGLG